MRDEGAPDLMRAGLQLPDRGEQRLARVAVLLQQVVARIRRRDRETEQEAEQTTPEGAYRPAGLWCRHKRRKMSSDVGAADQLELELTLKEPTVAGTTGWMMGCAGGAGGGVTRGAGETVASERRSEGPAAAKRERASMVMGCRRGGRGKVASSPSGFT
jgi:hypothetical protein